MSQVRQVSSSSVNVLVEAYNTANRGSKIAAINFKLNKTEVVPDDRNRVLESTNSNNGVGVPSGWKPEDGHLNFRVWGL